jgi:hypothetical protein
MQGTRRLVCAKSGAPHAPGALDRASNLSAAFQSGSFRSKSRAASVYPGRDGGTRPAVRALAHPRACAGALDRPDPSSRGRSAGLRPRRANRRCVRQPFEGGPRSSALWLGTSLARYLKVFAGHLGSGGTLDQVPAVRQSIHKLRIHSPRMPNIPRRTAGPPNPPKSERTEATPRTTTAPRIAHGPSTPTASAEILTGTHTHGPIMFRAKEVMNASRVAAPPRIARARHFPTLRVLLTSRSPAYQAPRDCPPRVLVTTENLWCVPKVAARIAVRRARPWGEWTTAFQIAQVATSRGSRHPWGLEAA